MGRWEPPPLRGRHCPFSPSRLGAPSDHEPARPFAQRCAASTGPPTAMGREAGGADSAPMFFGQDGHTGAEVGRRLRIRRRDLVCDRPEVLAFIPLVGSTAPQCEDHKSTVNGCLGSKVPEPDFEPLSPKPPSVGTRRCDKTATIGSSGCLSAKSEAAPPFVAASVAASVAAAAASANAAQLYRGGVAHRRGRFAPKEEEEPGKAANTQGTEFGAPGTGSGASGTESGASGTEFGASGTEFGAPGTEF
eukprot:gene14783-biopygen12194